MTDEKIIELFWQRDETAIGELSAKYGNYCGVVCGNILDNLQDKEECLNDTWLRAWNSIPPQSPKNLKMFLAKITRNLAIDRYKRQKSAKRGRGETELILEELEECISHKYDVEREVFSKEIGIAINEFLKTLSERDRNVFIRRYFYAESAEKIAKRYTLKATHVPVILTRTRMKLKNYLMKGELL
ncbi:MAG: sigma-70 family RNA polymerase sigma factor [Clostridia bacterium]|nr:sigma-70 family RNA polymerase sigma factor [Clostridia bacterium]